MKKETEDILAIIVFVLFCLAILSIGVLGIVTTLRYDVVKKDQEVKDCITVLNNQISRNLKN